MSKILIDTCAWIDFLRSKKGILGDYVESAIETDQALLCGPVVTELLQGAKGMREKEQLELLFSGVETLDVTKNDWVKAGLRLQTLRKNGITLPVTDALIATIASRNSVPVLTIDKHFENLSVSLVNPIKK